MDQHTVNTTSFRVMYVYALFVVVVLNDDVLSLPSFYIATKTQEDIEGKLIC